MDKPSKAMKSHNFRFSQKDWTWLKFACGYLKVKMSKVARDGTLAEARRLLEKAKNNGKGVKP